jgi:hypothetical protein
VLKGCFAIIDFSSSRLPAQIEIISIVCMAKLRSQEVITIPTDLQLKEDAWCIRYDSVVDCISISMYKDARRLAPFHNREVPAELYLDSDGVLCGVAVYLRPTEVASVLQRVFLGGSHGKA